MHMQQRHRPAAVSVWLQLLLFSCIHHYPTHQRSSDSHINIFGPVLSAAATPPGQICTHLGNSAASLASGQLFWARGGEAGACHHGMIAGSWNETAPPGRRWELASSHCQLEPLLQPEGGHPDSLGILFLGDSLDR
jgi:hypothetical protein